MRLMPIPLAWMLVHVPGTVNRLSFILCQEGASECSHPAISFIQGVCDPSQGTLNFVLTLSTDLTLQRELSKAYKRRWPNGLMCFAWSCCEKREDQQSLTSSVKSCRGSAMPRPTGGASKMSGRGAR